MEDRDREDSDTEEYLHITKDEMEQICQNPYRKLSVILTVMLIALYFLLKGMTQFVIQGEHQILWVVKYI